MTPDEAKAKVATMTVEQRRQAILKASQDGWYVGLLGGWCHEDGRRVSCAEVVLMYADKPKEPQP